MTNEDNITEPQTGIQFPIDLNGMAFVGCGVRKKLLIKIYAVGTYIDKAVIKALDKATLSNKERIQEALCNPTLIPRTIRIVTYWTIPSSILTKGIMDSMRPRIEGKKTSEEIAIMEQQLFDIMPKGDVEAGTEIIMVVNDDTYILLEDGGIFLGPHDLMQGNCSDDSRKKIQDKDFCDALCGVYFDKEAVSIDHKESVIERLLNIVA